ncbi:MAG: murein biosynthesis integral membrane protein MurJ [Alphaproteobacteria bacterium RIFCSPHIGHO2_01_FULL_41_14]|nr:MAG: murein biosynthesis integral membrane protein MurJ [Alphaproteobacteria bacterium GWB1_45_5]OFW76073.1 MAG: murein biosynthesis integral membrane protein MurJ [Alphaproteobacteria bacterium GWA1_45_9]OFW90271.1 MAG: murein biosynthesis integral membrane protein MurJ [Alphaproteobacteria bacterium RIFCSPHIGHO2_01_FULL_41_14]HCI48267.1 murein biosynthesis integral membrane protein MurJ [Holosporales bacterium]
MKLIRSFLSVSGFTILSRVTGFVRETLQAYYIGVNAVSDALGIAIKIPSLFRRIFAEGAFNVSFVPVFSGILAREGRSAALSFAQNIFSFLAITLTALIIIVEFFLPDLIPLFFRGLVQTPDRLALTISFSKITFPFLFFISLTAFFSGILNSFERFAAAAASPAAGNLFIIGCLLYLSPALHSPGYALAWGILGCGIIQFLWVFVPCQFSKIAVFPKKPKITPQVRTFFRTLLPAALGSSVVQINLFLDIMIASYLKIGGISYMSYADRLAQLPLSVIGIALSTVLLPTLSKYMRTQNWEQTKTLQTLALESALTLSVPAGISLMLLAPFLVDNLYAHGEFKQEDILPTAHTLCALASGLPAYILIKLFSTCFFSSGDTRTPMFIGAGGVLLNVTLNLLLINSLEYVGLALATSISAWVQATVLGIFLKKKRLFFFSTQLSNYIRKLSIPVLVLVAYLTVLVPSFELFIKKIAPSSWILLPAILGPGIGLYILFAAWVGIFRPSYFKNFSKDL